MKRGRKPSGVGKVVFYRRVTPEQKVVLDRALLEAKVDQHILGEHLRVFDRQRKAMRVEYGVEEGESPELSRLRAENERLKARIKELEDMYQGS